MCVHSQSDLIFMKLLWDILYCVSIVSGDALVMAWSVMYSVDAFSIVTTFRIYLLFFAVVGKVANFHSALNHRVISFITSTKTT